MTSCPFCPAAVADLQGHLALCSEAPAGVRALALTATALDPKTASGPERVALAQRLGAAIAESLWEADPRFLGDQAFLLKFEGFWALADLLHLAALEPIRATACIAALRRWHYLRRPRA